MKGRHGDRRRRTAGSAPRQIVTNPKTQRQNSRNWEAVEHLGAEVAELRSLVGLGGTGDRLVRFEVAQAVGPDVALVTGLTQNGSPGGDWNQTGDQYWAFDWTRDQQFGKNLQRGGAQGSGKLSTDLLTFENGGNTLPVLEVILVEGAARFIEYSLPAGYSGSAEAPVLNWWGAYPNFLAPGSIVDDVRVVLLVDSLGKIAGGQEGDTGYAIYDEQRGFYIPICPNLTPAGGPFLALKAIGTSAGNFDCDGVPVLNAEGLTMVSPAPFTVPWPGNIEVVNTYGLCGVAGDELLFDWVAGQASLVQVKHKCKDMVTSVKETSPCGLEYTFVKACVPMHSTSQTDEKEEIYEGRQVDVITDIKKSTVTNSCLTNVTKEMVCVQSGGVPTPGAAINHAEFCHCCGGGTNPSSCTCVDLPPDVFLEILGCVRRTITLQQQDAEPNVWAATFSCPRTTEVSEDEDERCIATDSEVTEFVFWMACSERPQEVNEPITSPELFIGTNEPGGGAPTKTFLINGEEKSINWKSSIKRLDFVCDPVTKLFQATFRTTAGAGALIPQSLVPINMNAVPPSPIPDECLPGWCNSCDGAPVGAPGSMVFVVRDPAGGE